MHRRDELLALVADGETVSGAARRLGIPRPTVYSWRARDERFAGRLAAALASSQQQRTGVGDGSLPDRRELLELLAAQARRGHVRAIELLLRVNSAKTPATVDAFGEVDELAVKRDARG